MTTTHEIEPGRRIDLARGAHAPHDGEMHPDGDEIHITPGPNGDARPLT